MNAWDRDPDDWDYRWDGCTHQELYDMVKTEATGAGAVGPAHEAWTSFAQLITESQANIEKLLTDAGASWEGQAADSMQQGVSPLAAWAGEATTAGQATVQSTQAHMDAFSSVSNSMPEPVYVPSQATKDVPPTTFNELLAGMSDEDEAAQKSDTAKQQAVELMKTYTANTQEASGALGTFDPPEDLGVSAAPRGEAGSGVDVDESGGMIDSDDYRGGSDTGDGSGGGSGGSGGYGGGSSPYPTGGPAGPSSGTDTAQSTAPGVLAPAATLPSASTAPTASNPFAPVSGTLFPPGGGAPAGTPGGRRGTSGGGGVGGGGGYAGGAPGGGSPTGGAPGGGAPGGGAAAPRPGVGGGAVGEPAAVRGGVAAGGARGGGAPMGGMPMGGGGRGEEDKERTSPQYMRGYHDEFWDDSPPVAPPVIGEDDD